MKSTLFLFALLGLCSFSYASTKCTRNGGCLTYDNNGNGYRCGPEGCGLIERSVSDGNRNARSNGNDYATTGNGKCGLYGCISDPYLENSRGDGNRRSDDSRHSIYGSTSGNAKCGINGCVTDAKECSWYAFWC